MQSRIDRPARHGSVGLTLALGFLLFVAAGVLAAQEPYSSFTEVPADLVPAGPFLELDNPATTLGTLTTYSDRTTFEALFPAVLVEDFTATLEPPNSVAACPPPFDENTNNACFAPGGIAPGIAVDVVQGSDAVVLTPPFLGVDCVAVGANLFSADSMLRFDPPVSGAGVDLVQPFGGQTMTVEVFGPGGSLGTIPGITGSLGGTFFGVETSDPGGIVRIEFREDAPQGDLFCDVTIPTTPPSVADVTATKVDLPGTPAMPGDTISYQIDIGNAGPDPATDVELDDTPDPNTTLVGGPTTTPLALDDGPYAGDPTTPTTVDGTLQPLLLDNDFGIPGTPTLAALPVVGQPTTLGGSVDVNADGSFTYTPPPGATGGETDTFTYDIQNGIPPSAPATDTATASILLGLAPVAQDDALSVTQNTVTVLDAAADNGSGADDFGVPAGAVDLYGPVGGPLTTPPGTNFATASGNTVNFDVSGNGMFAYDATVNATFSGNDTFEYQITNSVGSDTAIVTIEVQAPPTAVDDSPDMLSVPGDPYHTALNTPLDSSAHASPPVLDNDDRGFPLADVVSYGTSGSPTDQTVPGAPTATDNGGTVVVSADGNFVYTPPGPTFTGPDFFGYRLQNGAGFDDGVVTIAVGVRPACDDEVDPDDYDAIGNVGIGVPNTSGVLIGDTGDEITVTGNTAPVSGGTAVVASDGGFDYTSGAGFTGVDTFTYTVGNGFGDSAPCTVGVTVADTIWFIDNEAAGGGDGTLGAPYDSLAAYATPALDDAGDIVFVDTGDGTSGGYDTGITLKNNQLLIGQGVDLGTASGLTLPPFSDPLPGVAANPIITNTAGDGVTLANANLVTGLDVDNATGAAITGTNTAGSTITQVGVDASGGQGLIFTGATGSIDVNGAVVTDGTGNGIDINGGSASFDFDAASSVTNPVGTAFRIDGGTASVVFNGSLTQANNAALVSINNHSTGTVTFQTGTLGATNGSGLQFSNADGAGYNFNGTTTLNGGDAGIDILGDSSGVFTFANTDITSPTGAAFTIDGLGGTSNAQVDFQVASSINQGSNAAAVSISDHDNIGGPPFVQFIGPVNATNGSGYQFDNADGTYSFNSACSLNGGDAGVDILNGSAGGFTFANLTIDSPTNGAFNVDSSSPLISYTGGSITQNSAATAYRANGNNGNAQNIAASITANTSTATGIALTSNAGATINFTGALDIDTTTAEGFVATGGGTVTTNAGVSNTVNTATGRGVHIANTTIGGSGVTFASVTVGAAPNAILLDTTGAGDFTVTGTTTATGVNGNAVQCETVAGDVTLGSLAISGTVVTSTQTFSDVDPGTGVRFLPDANGDGDAIFLDGVTGSFTANGGTIMDVGDNALDVFNSSDVTLSGVAISDGGDGNSFSTANATVQATTSSNIHLIDVSISDFGDEVAAASTIRESAMAYRDVSGTATIQRTTVDTGTGFVFELFAQLPENLGLELENRNVDVVVNVTGSTFRRIDFEGIQIRHLDGDVTLNVDGATADSANTFEFINGAAINFGQTAADTGVSDGIFYLGDTNLTDVGIGARVGLVNTSDVTLDFIDNVVTRTFSDGFRIRGFGGATASTLVGRITGNLLDDVGLAVSTVGGQLGAGNGLEMLMENRTDTTVLFDDNTIDDVIDNGGSIGINVANNSLSEMDLVFTNNIVRGITSDGAGGEPETDFQLITTGSGVGAATTCLALTGNDFTPTSPVGSAGVTYDTKFDIGIDGQGSSLTLEDYAAPAGPDCSGLGLPPGAEPFVAANNTTDQMCALIEFFGVGVTTVDPAPGGADLCIRPPTLTALTVLGDDRVAAGGTLRLLAERDGVPVARVPVRFTVEAFGDSTAFFPAGRIAYSDENGVVSLPIESNGRAGSYTIRADAIPATGAPLSFNVTND